MFTSVDLDKGIMMIKCIISINYEIAKTEMLLAKANSFLNKRS